LRVAKARRFGAAPFVLAALLAAALGYQQAVAGLLVRERAQALAWVRLVPASWSLAAARDEPLFATPALRLLLARRALADGALDAAARRIDALAPSPDRDDLAARLAEERGDEAEALRDFIAAGDVPALEERVQTDVASGRLAAAEALQREIVARLEADAVAGDTLPEAWLTLGRIEQAQAYRAGTATPQGRADAREAVGAYERAVALAPLSARYLVAAGAQALNVGDLASAASYFSRARDADPSAADAYAGLGEAARRGGDLAAARRYLSAAAARDPAAGSVRRLARELGP
jgi:tetratricopeptide (TPR) repeat protein